MPTQLGFDYSTCSAENRKVISEHAKAITLHIRHSTRSMVDIGRRLMQVREILGSVFNAWVGAEFQWSLVTARSYMKLAEVFGDLDCLDSFQPSALIALTRKHVPRAAIDQAVARARNGELITKTMALDLSDRIVLQQFEENRHAELNIDRASTVGAPIRPHTAALTEQRIERRGRPTSTLRTLKSTVQTMRKNMQHVYEAISEFERKSLADELMELAKQLIHEPVIEGDVETAPESIPLFGKPGRRELATV
jgi:hypothetical protein